MNASTAAAQQNEVKLFLGFSRPQPLSREENFHKNSNLFKLLNFLLGSNFHPRRRERGGKTELDTENSSGKINKRLHNLLLVGSLRRFLLRLKETQKICCKTSKILNSFHWLSFFVLRLSDVIKTFRWTYNVPNSLTLENLLTLILSGPKKLV